MKSLLKREISVSKQFVLIGIVIFAAVLVFMTLEISADNLEEPLLLIPMISIAVPFVVSIRAMIEEEKDEINRFLKLLPIPQSKIVAAKFIFLNVLYLIFFTITLVYQIILMSLYPEIFTLIAGIQYLAFSVSLFLLNFILLGYYIFGAAVAQVFAMGGFAIIFFAMKIIPDKPFIDIEIVLLILSIIFSAFCYFLSCKFFESNGLGRLLAKKVAKKYGAL